MLFLPALHCAVLYSVMPYVMAEQWAVCVTAVSMVRVAESVSQHSMPRPCALCWGKELSFSFLVSASLSLSSPSLCNPLTEKHCRSPILQEEMIFMHIFLSVAICFGSVHIFSAAEISSKSKSISHHQILVHMMVVINKTLLWSIIDRLSLSGMKFCLCWLAG